MVSSSERVSSPQKILVTFYAEIVHFVQNCNLVIKCPVNSKKGEPALYCAPFDSITNTECGLQEKQTLSNYRRPCNLTP